jgi:hypothetical protein
MILRLLCIWLVYVHCYTFAVLGFAVLQVWFIVVLRSCPICLVVYCFLC